MFRHKLRDLRRGRNLTQDQLAGLLDVAKSTISLIETGERMPSIEVLYKISKVFNVTMDWLVREDGLTIKEQPQLNTITLIGSSGTYKTFELSDEEIMQLEKIAQDMHGSDDKPNKH